MAAYAALVSIMNITEQIMDHSRLPTSFHHNQMESLREVVDFLLDFIESYTSSKEARDLESQIASAAYAAEDAIESHVVDQIHAGFGQISSTSLLNLQKVIEEMDLIKEKVKKVKEERGIPRNVQPSNPKSTTGSLLSTASASAKKAMVGFDEELIQLMDVLTGYESSRQIISIFGMGGIGKTTLTRNAFETPLIVQHFDIRGWVTISHSFSVREILLELLSCQEIKEKLSDRKIDQQPDDQLVVKLYKTLWGRRYLIVLDDVWSVESWDEIRSVFPDNGNGSRIVVTTRLSNVAALFSSLSFNMNFLDGDKSWDLFCRTAFPQEDCPLELEEIGKKIVRKCKGLPLSIVVIGAFLGKSSRAKENWENVARDINSILRSDGDELCLNLLSLSYSHLPAHLKPCFLYMGILRKDEKINSSRLTKLFIAEGFLKPNKMQTLEEIAQDNLKDLVDRNLILVSGRRWNGTAKFYYIHDLLREVCLRQAEKEKFLHVTSVRDVLQGIDLEERRIVFHNYTTKHRRDFDAIPSAELVRSLIFKGGPLPFKSRLLKVLSMVDSDSLEVVFQQLNLRYLAYKSSRNLSARLPSSTSQLWNMQTLIIKGETKRVVAPPEIWNMRQLRHLEFNEICLPDPPTTSDTEDQQGDCVLQNLQTLVNVVNFTFSEDVCRRIPNIKKLYIRYDDFSGDCLHIDLCFLNKLQSLGCSLDEEARWGDFALEFTFPSSLQKLSLFGCHVHWDKVTSMGMMLPHLEVLKLDSVIGAEWNLVEGAFPRLKSLSIYSSDLIYWSADESHFPVLEKLFLGLLPKLDEIPLDIGGIAALGRVDLVLCSMSAAISSTKILEEQLSLGNEDIQVRLLFIHEEEMNRFKEKVDVNNFPKKNFHCKLTEQLTEQISEQPSEQQFAEQFAEEFAEQLVTLIEQISEQPSEQLKEQLIEQFIRQFSEQFQEQIIEHLSEQFRSYINL